MTYFDQLDHYLVLKLETEDFPARLELPEGYSYVEDVSSDTERALLEPAFPGWRRVVERRLPGMRDNSRVTVAFGDEPVAICYVTADNQLRIKGYGELHYAAVADEHRGQGLWNVMITELFARAAAWGVAGVLFVTDRAGPIEMYYRIGAQRIGIRPKDPAWYIPELVPPQPTAP